MYTDIYTCIYHCTKCTVCRATDVHLSTLLIYVHVFITVQSVQYAALLLSVMPRHIFFEAIAGPLCFEISIQIDEKYV